MGGDLPFLFGLQKTYNLAWGKSRCGLKTNTKAEQKSFNQFNTVIKDNIELLTYVD